MKVKVQVNILIFFEEEEKKRGAGTRKKIVSEM